ncbi:MAG TPA: Rad52/Rad22 family DNA repair protein [Candidatus Angelobacter sp.]|nr:Rad52/Rad22 family DNA repair protein [Candidatus Angelobacter sp.]
MSAPNGHAGNSSASKPNGTGLGSEEVNNEFRSHVTGENLTRFIVELQVPFDPSLIDWRVTNTARDKKRGQVIPYADQRAYTDRLNGLVTPAGWTRKYTIQTSPSFERGKDQKTVAKILVTCELTIFGIGSHSATGEEWADDDNAATAAEAQAFKRACVCVGLGRYLYYFEGVWVDLDQNKRPKRLPQLPLWATPDGWRRGLRPDKRTTGSTPETPKTQSTNCADKGATHVSDQSIVSQIEAMAQPLGRALYRGILKSVARVWSPRGIHDAIIEKRVLQHMLAADRGLIRLKAAVEKTGPEHLRKTLAFLNIQCLERIDTLELLKKVVTSLESIDRKA